MKEWIKKYRHAWVFSYLLIYLVWFFLLEKYVDDTFYVVDIWLDQ